MYYIETDRIRYEKMKKLLPDFRADMIIELESMDSNLEKLGFVDTAPCVVKIDISEDELDALMDELVMIEINAFNTSDGKNPPKDDVDYQMYLKYGWMWDELFKAESEEERRVSLNDRNQRKT